MKLFLRFRADVNEGLRSLLRYRGDLSRFRRRGVEQFGSYLRRACFSSYPRDACDYSRCAQRCCSTPDRGCKEPRLLHHHARE
jgi:hypothetical protein